MPSAPDSRVCEFTIEALHGDVCVDGRNCRADLPIGTRFVAIVEYAFVKKQEPQGSYSLSSEEVRQFPISCRVVGVEAYRRQLEFVAHGYTARLTLEGISRDQLAPFARVEKNRLFVLRSAENA